MHGSLVDGDACVVFFCRWRQVDLLLLGILIKHLLLYEQYNPGERCAPKDVASSEGHDEARVLVPCAPGPSFFIHSRIRCASVPEHLLISYATIHELFGPAMIRNTLAAESSRR